MAVRIRCTRKLATKIKATLPDETDALSLPMEWYANLIRHDGSQLVVAMDSGTLATVLFLGKEIVSSNALAEALSSAANRMFKRNGWTIALERFVDTDPNHLEILPTTGKRLLGSLTEMIRLIKGHLEYGEKDLEAIAEQVNQAPMSYIDHKAPKWLLDDLCMKRKNGL
jgi:hypothetical protein